MGEIVKNFNEFHSVNEAKGFKNTEDFEAWLEEIDGMTEAAIKKIMGKNYIDTPGMYQEEKDDYDDVIDFMTSNMGKKEFDKLEQYWIYNIHESVDEGRKAKVSKSLLNAIDKYHAAQLAFQQLQKEFLSIPKEDTQKRDKMKDKLLATHKETKAAEAEFQATLGQEGIDDYEIIW
jgi:hypothetical protein